MHETFVMDLVEPTSDLLNYAVDEPWGKVDGRHFKHSVQVAARAQLHDEIVESVGLVDIVEADNVI